MSSSRMRRSGECGRNEPPTLHHQKGLSTVTASRPGTPLSLRNSAVMRRMSAGVAMSTSPVTGAPSAAASTLAAPPKECPTSTRSRPVNRARA